MLATVLRTPTPKPSHTPLVHSMCVHPSASRAVTRAAADLAGRRGRGLAAGPWRVRRKSAGHGHGHLPSPAGNAERLDAGRAHGAAGRRPTGDVPAPHGG